MSYIGNYPVPVIIGGTGDTTLTAHGVLLGEGTSAISATSAGSAGQVILSGGSSADPSYVTPTAGTGLSVTTNATTMSYALTGTVSVSNGGTGSTTFPVARFAIGNGTSPLTFLAAGTNGQIPIGSTGSAPVLATITAGSGVSVTNALRSITIASTGGSSGITTIDGNTGSATGKAITITSGAAGTGGTSLFTGSGTTMTMTFSDSRGNTGIGTDSMTTGASLSNNVALGNLALTILTSGNNNVGIGQDAGTDLLSGSNNTFIGYFSGKACVSGSNNTCYGSGAAQLATGSNNTCLGYQAGNAFVGGSYNTLVGYQAGINYTGSESSNICINSPGTTGESNVLRIGSGTGTATQQLNSSTIFGIAGVTVTGVAALVSSSDQIGVLSSSKKFKNDIQDMGNSSNKIYDLRPVTFTWDRGSAPGLSDASTRRQFGLVAEEVAETIPTLVTYEPDLKPLSVNYSGLSSLILNEVQKLSERISALRERV